MYLLDPIQVAAIQMKMRWTAAIITIVAGHLRKRRISHPCLVIDNRYNHPKQPQLLLVNTQLQITLVAGVVKNLGQVYTTISIIIKTVLQVVLVGHKKKIFYLVRMTNCHLMRYGRKHLNLISLNACLTNWTWMICIPTSFLKQTTWENVSSSAKARKRKRSMRRRWKSKKRGMNWDAWSMRRCRGLTRRSRRTSTNNNRLTSTGRRRKRQRHRALQSLVGGVVVMYKEVGSCHMGMWLVTHLLTTVIRVEAINLLQYQLLN